MPLPRLMLWLCARAALSLGRSLISTVYGVSLFQGGYLKCWIGSSESRSARPRIDFLIRSNWVGIFFED